MLSYVYPTRAGIEVDEKAPPEYSADRVREALAKAGPEIDRLCELIDSAARLDETPLTAGVVRTCYSVLLADASACYDRSDYPAAYRRIVHALRLHTRVERFNGQAMSFRVASATVACAKVRAMAEHGAAPGDAAPELLVALRSLRLPDRELFVSTWERYSRSRVATLRTELGGPDGPAGLRDAVARDGIDAIAIPSIAALLGVDDLAKHPELLECGTYTHAAHSERAPSARAIRKGLDLAEKMIPRYAEALRSDSPAASMLPLAREVIAEPTQVARAALGSPAADWLVGAKADHEIAETIRLLGGSD